MGLGHYILQSLSSSIPKVSLNRAGSTSAIAEIKTKVYVWDDFFFSLWSLIFKNAYLC